MNIQVQCRNCGQQYSVAAQWAGTQTNCQRCGGPVVIPPAPQQPAHVPTGMPQPGMQPAGGPGWTAPPAAKSSGGRKAAIVLAIVGGGALLLTGVVLAVVWGLRGGGVGAVAWEPKPALAAQLQPEVGVGRFAVRPPPGYQLTRTESSNDDGVSRAHWYWKGPSTGGNSSRFEIFIKQNPRFRKYDAPQVITDSRYVDSENETYFVPRADVSHGTINGMPATRIAQPRGSFSIYVIYDDDTVVSIKTFTRPGDTQSAALGETASRTLRQGGAGVPVAKVVPPVTNPPAPGGGVIGGSTVPPKPPELEPGAVAVAEPYSKEPDAWATPAVPENFRPPVAIKLPKSGARVRFPATPSSCVMLGREVWDYRTGARLGRVNGPESDDFQSSAVSPDGKLLVLNDNKAGLQMWSFETGRLLQTAANPGEGRTDLEWAGFRSPTEALLVVDDWDGSVDNVVLSWTAGSDQPRQLFATESSWGDEFALSEDGNLFAFSDGTVVRVADLRQTNRPARYFDSVGTPRPGAGLAALAFSPDATRLAGYTSYIGGVELFVWDVASGKLESSHRVLVDRPRSSASSRLRWLPDDAGFLLAGQAVLDRHSGRPLWQLRAGQNPRFVGRELNRDHLLVIVRQGSDRYLTAVPIPWKQISEATQLAASPARAPVRPTSTVGLEVYIQGVQYGDPAETQRRLAQLVQQRLKLEGIGLHKGGDVRLYVKYKEREGDVREIVEVERGRWWRNRERSTGETVVTTFGEVEIGWKRSSQAEPLWHAKLRVVPASSYKGEIDEYVVRESMFGRMQSYLLRIPIPYVLSADGRQMLPVVSDLAENFKGFDQAETAPPGEATALKLAALPPLPAVEEAMEGILGDPFAARRAQLELDPWVRPALPKDGTPKLWLPLDINDAVVYPRTPSPFVAVGTDLWNLESGEIVGSLDLGPNIRNLSDSWQPALSPDGKLLAVWEGYDSDTVSVWSWETGRKIRAFKARQGEARLIWSGFRGPHELVLVWQRWAGTNNNVIQIWNASTGDPIHALSTARFEDREFALSPTGEKLAFVVNDGLWVIDLTTESKKPKKYSGPKDVPSAFSFFEGLGFAPDGRQIVAYTRTGRVMVWKSSTSFTDRRYPEMLLRKSTVSPSRVLWLPDSSGYLLGNRALIDHESGRVLWLLNLTSRVSRQPLAFLDQDHLLVPERGASLELRLVSVEVPWEAIRAGLRALTRKSPAYVGQGAVVGFDVELLAADDGVGGAPVDPSGFPDPGLGEPSPAAQLRARLGKAVTDRLKLDGVRLGPGAAIEFYVLYGQQTEEPEVAPDPVIDPGGPGGMGPFGPGGWGRPGGFGGFGPADNGPRIKTILQIGYRLPRAKKPLWAETIISTGRSSSGGDDDETAAIARSVEAALYDVMIPYFIPKNSDLPILPVVSQL